MFVPWNLLASYCTEGVALENESLCLSTYMCKSSDLTVYKKDGKWICQRPQSGLDLSEINTGRGFSVGAGGSCFVLTLKRWSTKLMQHV